MPLMDEILILPNSSSPTTTTMGQQHSQESLLGHNPQQKPWPELPPLVTDRINGILVNQIVDQQRLAEEDEAPEILECREQKEYELFWYNLACCLFHLIQAIAVLGLGLGNSQLSKFKLPLTTLFTIWPNGYPQQQLVIRGYLPFVAATSGFAFMSAFAHAAVLIGYSCYVCDLRRRINRFRWIEYAFSSSWMIALIAMLFGCYDILTLVLIASVSHVKMKVDILSISFILTDTVPFFVSL